MCVMFKFLSFNKHQLLGLKVDSWDLPECLGICV